MSVLIVDDCEMLELLAKHRTTISACTDVLLVIGQASHLQGLATKPCRMNEVTFTFVTHMLHGARGPVLLIFM
jgi:hypothetical protein